MDTLQCPIDVLVEHQAQARRWVGLLKVIRGEIASTFASSWGCPTGLVEVYRFYVTIEMPVVQQSPEPEGNLSVPQAGPGIHKNDDSRS